MKYGEIPVGDEQLPPPKNNLYSVRVAGYALVEQVHEVEADTPEEAEEMVRSDEYDTYYGNNEWKYKGVEGDSIVVEVTQK